jgi:hypothetical protein
MLACFHMHFACCMLCAHVALCNYTVPSHAPCSMPILDLYVACCVVSRAGPLLTTCCAFRCASLYCCNDAVQILQFLELPSNVAALEVVHMLGLTVLTVLTVLQAVKRASIPGSVVWPYDPNGSATAMRSPHVASCTCGADTLTLAGSAPVAGSLRIHQ